MILLSMLWVGYQLYQYILNLCVIYQDIISNQLRKSNQLIDQNNQLTDTRVYVNTLNNNSIIYNDSEMSSYVSYSENSDINLDLNDNHNVHNITIIEHLKSNLDKLFLSTKQLIKFDQIIRELKKYQIGYPYLNKVLRFIQDSQAKYSVDKIKETDILSAIWTRINCDENLDNRSKLIEEFVNQLNDCYNIDEQTIRCLEGRVVRYFQVLELYDYQINQWNIVPLWYYKQEIEQYCAKQLNEMINRFSPEEQLIYIKLDPSDEEKLKINNWNQELIKHIKQNIEQTYDQKIDKINLNKILEPCINAIID